MKISLNLLKNFIDLPLQDTRKLRVIFDELGLEVEDVITEGGETFFKIEILAHRGDHLSLLGIARELSSRLLLPIRSVEAVERVSFIFPHPVFVHTDTCFRYACTKVSLDKVALETLLQKIQVVQQELGQPLHAFDLDTIEGPVYVVVSTDEEVIDALDGKTYKVPPGSILIRDGRKSIAVAGVIGSAATMVTSNTKRVFIESASFDPVCVRKTARKMGISTEASYIFERGCDVNMALFAIKRLLFLLGNTLEHYDVGYYSGENFVKKKIEISIEQLRRYLCLQHLREEEVCKKLAMLGYVVEQKHEKIIVEIPSWRFWNVQTASSVIEDFARVYGLHRIPLVIPPLEYHTSADHEMEIFLGKVETCLLGTGFFEVKTKSYYSKEAAALLHGIKKHITIKNSIDREYSHLKMTNAIHLAKLADYNLKKGEESVKVYECSRIFYENPEGPYKFERDVLSLVVSGRWYTSAWKKKEASLDLVYYLKGVVEAIGSSFSCEVTMKESSIDFLHPGRQAHIMFNGVQCGFMGCLHPQIQEKLELTEDLVYVELDVAKCMQCWHRRELKIVSEYPSIKRDITLKIPKRCLAYEIVEYIHLMKVPDLKGVSIVDAFQVDEEDFRRVTYRCTFQSVSRTLQREEVDEVMEGILAKLLSPV